MVTLNQTMCILKTVITQINSLDRLFLMAVGANNHAALSINNERARGIEFKVAPSTF